MNEAATSPVIPATPGPKEIGAQMAALREQFSLSQQEVSERLHIRARYVSAIEEGRYDLMPGKVYARGYVHTYAEFLGLNPNEIVAQCFVGELPANAQPIPPIAAARYSTPAARTSISASPSSRWRGYAVLGAVLLVIVLVGGQFMGRGGDIAKPEETSVAPVPEAMLASVRDTVMPLPENYECLTSDTFLSCFNTDETTYLLGHIDEDQFLYGGEISAASLVASVAATDEAPAEENPDSPEVAITPAVTDVPVVAIDPTIMDEDQKNEPGPPHD